MDLNPHFLIPIGVDIMKNVNIKLFLSTLFATTVLLSAAANATNGTKKPPALTQTESNTTLLIAGKVD